MAKERSYEFTPTWVVATVFTIFIVISLILERCLHHLGHWLQRTKRKPLYEALELIREELMLLGFITLVITIASPYLYDVCVDSSFYNKQRAPCSMKDMKDSGKKEKTYLSVNCKEGKEPLVTYKTMQQIHKFIFVLAVTHIFYSGLTMLLAMIKVRQWRKWEDEAHSNADSVANQNQFAEMTRNITYRRQATFVRHHLASGNKPIMWLICFFRQFGQTVTKSDYLALRMGFLLKHNLPPKYDFHQYIVRSMEDDFKHIIGISPLLWIYVLAYMLVNVDGLDVFFWISFLPVVLVLVIGAKLQHVIATFALESSGLFEPVTSGLHLRPRDELFWFKRPHLLLYVIHFTLFQNAFELATFFWIWWQFGWDSCYMRNKYFLFIQGVVGLLVQVISSYSTLPLYALVTQMGSHYKKTILPDKMVESLHRWRHAAKHNRHADHSGSEHDHETSLPTQREQLDDIIEESNDQELETFSSRRPGRPFFKHRLEELNLPTPRPNMESGTLKLRSPAVKNSSEQVEIQVASTPVASTPAAQRKLKKTQEVID